MGQLAKRHPLQLAFVQRKPQRLFIEQVISHPKMEVMRKMKYPLLMKYPVPSCIPFAPASLRRACLVQDTIAGFFKKGELWCMVGKCSEQHPHQAASQSAYGSATLGCPRGSDPYPSAQIKPPNVPPPLQPMLRPA